MTDWTIRHSRDYCWNPKTVNKTRQGYLGTYTAIEGRMEKLHELSSNVGLFVLRGVNEAIDPSEGHFVPANTVYQFRPNRAFPAIAFQRTAGEAFSNTEFVTIAIRDVDSEADPSIATFVDATAGDFSRSSVASYRTAASAIAFASTNELRLEYRGDTQVPIPLLEGPATNYNTYANTINSWSGTGDALVTTNAVISPDGDQNASRLQYTNPSWYGPTQAAGDLEPFTLSFWCRTYQGPVHYETRAYFGGNYGIIVYGMTTDAWSFASNSSATSPDDNGIVFDGRPDSLRGPTLPATDIALYGVQLEQSLFPTSTILTSGATAARSADVLTFTSDDYDARMCTLGGYFTFYPLFSDSDITEGEFYYMFSFGSADDGIRVTKDSGDALVQVVQAGSVVAQSNPLTFDRHQGVRVSFSPALGTIAVTGADTGNGETEGVPWTFTNTDLRMGGVYAANNEAYSRITNVRFLL